MQIYHCHLWLHPDWQAPPAALRRKWCCAASVQHYGLCKMRQKYFAIGSVIVLTFNTKIKIWYTLDFGTHWVRYTSCLQSINWQKFASKVFAALGHGNVCLIKFIVTRDGHEVLFYQSYVLHKIWYMGNKMSLNVQMLAVGTSSNRHWHWKDMLYTLKRVKNLEPHILQLVTTCFMAN